jgi:hypothetical protein
VLFDLEWCESCNEKDFGMVRVLYSLTVVVKPILHHPFFSPMNPKTLDPRLRRLFTRDLKPRILNPKFSTLNPDAGESHALALASSPARSTAKRAQTGKVSRRTLPSRARLRAAAS